MLHKNIYTRQRGFLIYVQTFSQKIQVWFILLLSFKTTDFRDLSDSPPSPPPTPLAWQMDMDIYWNRINVSVM